MPPTRAHDTSTRQALDMAMPRWRPARHVLAAGTGACESGRVGFHGVGERRLAG